MTWTVPAGYQFVNVGHCRACGRTITWAKSDVTGRAAPFDRDGQPHLTSCTSAEVLRRTRAWVHAS